MKAILVALLGIIEEMHKRIKEHNAVSAIKRLQSETKKAKSDIERVEKEMNFIIPKIKSDKSLESYFKILGIKSTKDKSLIKQAYRKKALQYHPDLGKVNNSEEMMKKLNNAYSALSKNSQGKESSFSRVDAAIEIEKRFINTYMSLRESDYSTFIGAARSAGNMDEVIGLAQSVTDWKSRAARSQVLMKGKIDSRIKALKKRRDKLIKLLKNADSSGLIYAHANEVSLEISRCLENAKAFQDAYAKAIDSAMARIIPLEEEQKKRLFSSLH